MISIRDFLMFLSEYKCLGSYWSNFEKAHFVDSFHGASRLILCFYDEHPRNWLLHSFSWDRSAEGFDYWYKLDTLWNLRCNFLVKNED